MKPSWRSSALVSFLFCPPLLLAGEAALYIFPGAQVEYEGTGYRQTTNGWELKVKPRSSGAGARWRHDFSEQWAGQTQYGRNTPFYAREDGNSYSETLRQTGQTKLAVQWVMADIRRPLARSSMEAVAGVQGIDAGFRRKDIVFNRVLEPASAHERIQALGAYFGFHDGRALPAGQRGFYWDGEATLGHLFLTRNRITADGGSIHRDGFTYNFRIEAGWQRGNWRAGAGYMRQLIQAMVRGGKALSTGAAASLPINKVDFFSPFVTVSYVY